MSPGFFFFFDLLLCGSGRAESFDHGGDGLEFLERDAIGEITGGGGGAAVSKLGLHTADIERGLPDVFGHGAAKVVDAELGAEFEFFLELLPLLGEALRFASWCAAAELVDHRELGIGVGIERGERSGDARGHRKRLLHLAFGEEGDRVGVWIVVGRRHFAGGLVADARVGDELEEEVESAFGVGEDEIALGVGRDRGAGFGLMEFGDRAVEVRRRVVDLREITEEADEAFGVGAFGVRAEFGPREGGRADRMRRELTWRLLSVRGAEGREGGGDVRVVRFELGEKLRGVLDGTRADCRFFSSL